MCRTNSNNRKLIRAGYGSNNTSAINHKHIKYNRYKNYNYLILTNGIP